MSLIRIARSLPRCLSDLPGWKAAANDLLVDRVRFRHCYEPHPRREEFNLKYGGGHNPPLALLFETRPRARTERSAT